MTVWLDASVVIAVAVEQEHSVDTVQIVEKTVVAYRSFKISAGITIISAVVVIQELRSVGIVRLCVNQVSFEIATGSDTIIHRLTVGIMDLVVVNVKREQRTHLQAFEKQLQRWCQEAGEGVTFEFAQVLTWDL